MYNLSKLIKSTIKTPALNQRGFKSICINGYDENIHQKTDYTMNECRNVINNKNQCSIIYGIKKAPPSKNAPVSPTKN